MLHLRASAPRVRDQTNLNLCAKTHSRVNRLVFDKNAFAHVIKRADKADLIAFLRNVIAIPWRLWRPLAAVLIVPHSPIAPAIPPRIVKRATRGTEILPGVLILQFFARQSLLDLRTRQRNPVFCGGWHGQYQ